MYVGALQCTIAKLIVQLGTNGPELSYNLMVDENVEVEVEVILLEES
jgi:hypothetical protein